MKMTIDFLDLKKRKIKKNKKCKKVKNKNLDHKMMKLFPNELNNRAHQVETKNLI